MSTKSPISVKSITQLHRILGLPTPVHPLISIADYARIQEPEGTSAVFDFYTISLKRGVNTLFYGQQEYDFDEGTLYFLGPNQVLRSEGGPNLERSGWILFVHPDFLWNTSLASGIKAYNFFHYSAAEALFLSGKEERIINDIVRNIEDEYSANLDKFSQGVIISQLELLLNYAQRFYERQFITRHRSSHQILTRLEDILAGYFDDKKDASGTLPTVQAISAQLNVSARYLSSLLKQLTGQTTQEHIHTKLIEKAKEKLSTTDLSVSEIAYELGFERSQSFNKLFKKQTSLSPLEFRRSFN